MSGFPSTFKTKLTHQDLTTLMEEFGYDKDMGGVCFGYCIMLAQSSLSKQEDKFFNRLNLIKSYYKDSSKDKEKPEHFKSLKDAIEAVQNKVKPGHETYIKNYKLTEQDIELLEIAAFMDGIILYLLPNKYNDLFAKKLLQENISEVYNIVKSETLKSTELQIVQNKSYAYTKKSLEEYLEDLAKILRQKDTDYPIIISTDKHGVYLRFDKNRNIWLYADTNNYANPFVVYPEGKYFQELNAKEAVSAIFKSLTSSNDEIVVINTKMLSTNVSDRLTNELAQLDLKYNYDIFQGEMPIYNKNCSLLYLCCREGNLKAVQKLLGSGIDLSQEKIYLALEVACQRGYAEIVTLLLTQTEADPNRPIDPERLEPIQDADNSVQKETTVLNIALLRGHFNVVKALLNFDGTDLQKGFKNCPILHRLCLLGETELVKILLARQPKVEVNQLDSDGHTALLLALQKNHLDIAQLLIDDPNINLTKKCNDIPLLHYAYSTKKIDIFKNLLNLREKIDPNQLDEDGKPIFFYLINNKKFELVKLLLAHPHINPNLGFDDSTLLQVCIANNAPVEIVKILLDKVDPNQLNKKNESALYYAWHYKNFEIAKLLLGRPDLDATLGFKNTPFIHFICETGETELLKALLSTHPNFNINVKDKNGVSALFYACQNNHLKTVETLLLAGNKVNPVFPDDKGYTPLFIACQNGYVDITSTLLAHMKKEVIEEEINRKEKSPLHIALQLNQPAIIREFLKFKDIRLNDNIALNLMQKACDNHYDEIVKDLFSLKTIYPLVNNENSNALIRLATTKGYGEKAFYGACEAGNSELVKILLTYNINHNKNEKGITPICIAYQLKHFNIVKLLLESEVIDINPRENAPVSLLHLACSGPHHDSELFKNILKKTSNLVYKNQAGKTALDLSIDSKNKVALIELVNFMQLDKEKLKNLISPESLNKLIAWTKEEHLPEFISDLVHSEELKVFEPKTTKTEAIKQSAAQNKEAVLTAQKSRKEMHQSKPEPLHTLPKNKKKGKKTKKHNIPSQQEKSTKYSQAPVSIHNQDTKNNQQVLDPATIETVDTENLAPFKPEEGLKKKEELLIKNDPTLKNESKKLTQEEFIRIHSDQLLFHACKEGKLDIVQKLLALGAQTEAPLLHIACLYHHPKIVKALLEHGFDPNRVENGLTALHLACQLEQLEIANLLLNQDKTDPNIIVDPSFLKPSSPTNEDAPKNITALHLAWQKKNFEMINALVKNNKFNPNLPITKSQTLLHLAALRGLSELVHILLSSKNLELNLLDNQGDTALSSAWKKGHYGIVQTLLNNPKTDPKLGFKKPGSLLLYAAAKGESEIVAILLAMPDKINPNLQDDNGITALYYACQNYHLDTVKVLLANDKINPNLSNLHGLTPLALACISGKLELVKLLLPSTLNLPDRAGKTPLHYAWEYSHTEIVKTLLSAGIDPNIAFEEGNTLFHLACSAGETALVKALLSTQIKIKDPNLVNEKGLSPIHLAYQNKHFDLVRWLLEQPDIDINPKKNKGPDSLLQIACIDLKDSTLFRNILEQSPNLAYKNQAGKTALDLAIQHKNEIAISALINFVKLNNDKPDKFISSDTLNLLKAWAKEKQLPQAVRALLPPAEKLKLVIPKTYKGQQKEQNDSSQNLKDQANSSALKTSPSENPEQIVISEKPKTQTRAPETQKTLVTHETIKNKKPDMQVPSIDDIKPIDKTQLTISIDDQSKNQLKPIQDKPSNEDNTRPLHFFPRTDSFKKPSKAKYYQCSALPYIAQDFSQDLFKKDSLPFINQVKDSSEQVDNTWKSVNPPAKEDLRIYLVFSEADKKEAAIGYFTELQDTDTTTLTVNNFPHHASSKDKATYALTFVLQSLALLEGSPYEDLSEPLLELNGDNPEEMLYILQALAFYGIPQNAWTLTKEAINKIDNFNLTLQEKTEMQAVFNDNSFTSAYQTLYLNLMDTKTELHPSGDESSSRKFFPQLSN